MVEALDLHQGDTHSYPHIHENSWMKLSSQSIYLDYSVKKMGM